MKVNVGGIDRILRIVVGLVLEKYLAKREKRRIIERSAR